MEPGGRQFHTYLGSAVSMRFFPVLLAALAAACAPQRTEPPPSLQSRVTAIDAQLNLLRRDTATVLGLSAEGASIEAAYEGTQLRRLSALYLGEMGRATDTFYFDSSAFFVLRREFRYDEPLSGRVADSSSYAYDLTRADISRAAVDSLQAVANMLLEHLRHPER